MVVLKKTETETETETDRQRQTEADRSHKLTDGWMDRQMDKLCTFFTSYYYLNVNSCPFSDHIHLCK